MGSAILAKQTYQLTRTYRFGPEAVTVPVRKPDPDTFVFYVDSEPVAAGLDPTTGIVTYTAPDGAALAWSGEFDLPVFFSSDDFEATLETWNAATIEVALEEDLSA